MVRLLRRRWPVIAGVLAVLAVAGFAATKLGDGSGEIGDLERASEAGERARSESEEIVEDLERIVANLEAGADLPEQSAEIHELTQKQEDSLKDLADILRSQLRALRRTGGSLEGARSAVTGVTRLGEEQERLLGQALSALRELRAFARDASARSARFAWRARYGARLAEDSKDSFSGP